MKGKGNYWLEIISKEKEFYREIQNAVYDMIGMSFSDYDTLHEQVMTNISNHLEQYGLKNNIGLFKLDYNVDLHYDHDFSLNGFNVRYVYIVDEFF